MKTFLQSTLGLFAALLLCQCASSPQTRIERNPQMFSQLGAKDRQLVTSGVIREGMTRDAVFLAWGRPDSISSGSNRGRRTENWTYTSERPVSTMNMSMGMGWGMGGWGWGGWGPYGWGGYPYWGGGPTVMYVPYTSGTVEFSGGRVIGWTKTAR